MRLLLGVATGILVGEAGYIRMIDVAIGAAIGLLFSQLFFTPNPIKMVDDAARQMLRRLASRFRKCAEALAEPDKMLAQTAGEEFAAASDGVVANIASARCAARWSLRGQLAAGETSEIVARYDRHAVRLYASALLFGEALANALRKSEAPPPGLSGSTIAVQMRWRVS